MEIQEGYIDAAVKVSEITEMVNDIKKVIL